MLHELYKPTDLQHKTAAELIPKMQHKTPKRWDELNDEQRQKVEDYIATLLTKQAEIPLVEKPNREVVERRQSAGVYYQLELVKCGKPRCRCAGGQGHGPYWYAYWRAGSKMKSKYIGKELKRLEGSSSDE